MDDSTTGAGCSLPFCLFLAGLVAGFSIITVIERIPFSQSACTGGIIGGLVGLSIGLFMHRRNPTDKSDAAIRGNDPFQES